MTSKERALKIIYKIKLAGSSQRAVAEMNRVKPQTVWNVIWGRSESKRVKKTIARIVGERVEDLWPDEDEGERAA